MARKHMTDDGEILGQATQYKPTGKSKDARRSHPSEGVYRKRKEWWESMGFGEDTAKWAAKWRLGEPKKKRGIESEAEQQAIDDAIRTAYRRKEVVASIERRTDKSREDIIRDLDEKMRVKDKAKKLVDHIKGVEWDTDIYSKSIEPNIFLDRSPD